MKWNVYYYNINKNKIESFNIFDHWRFNEEVKDFVGKYNNKDEFKDLLKRSLMYWFWSKCEWEILLKPWVGKNGSKEIKIDVYDQVMLNFDVFADYVWENKKELLDSK